MIEFTVTNIYRTDGTAWQRVSLPSKISIENLDAIKEWCHTKFGARARGSMSMQLANWSMSLDGRSYLFFKHPENVTLFLLKWS
jgi:hypothetical protein